MLGAKERQDSRLASVVCCTKEKNLLWMRSCYVACHLHFMRFRRISCMMCSCPISIEKTWPFRREVSRLRTCRRKVCIYRFVTGYHQRDLQLHCSSGERRGEKSSSASPAQARFSGILLPNRLLDSATTSLRTRQQAWQLATIHTLQVDRPTASRQTFNSTMAAQLRRAQRGCTLPRLQAWALCRG